ncbi:hypothetical protein BH10PSE17_BH10PSE17_19540 [soil metagenome]
MEWIRRTVLAFAIAAVSCTPAAARDDLAGTWTLRIRNLDQREVVSLTVRFADAKVDSCMGDDWKRVVVQKVGSADEHFFPAQQPLSYRTSGSELVIGRTEVCDSYLLLEGKRRGDSVGGDYVGFGKGGKPRKGDFTLERDR